MKFWLLYQVPFLSRTIEYRFLQSLSHLHYVVLCGMHKEFLHIKDQLRLKFIWIYGKIVAKMLYFCTIQFLSSLELITFSLAITILMIF